MRFLVTGAGSFYKETERPEPILTYGRTKLRGEEAILAEAQGSVVLRVSLVHGRGYGPRPTASEAIAWALRARRPLRLFTDQYRAARCASWAGHREGWTTPSGRVGRGRI